MRHSIAMKFIAFLLAACGVAAAAGSAVGIALSIEMDLYSTDYDEWYEDQTRSKAEVIAGWIADRYAANTYSDCPEQVLNAAYANVTNDTLSQWYQVPVTSWYYTISDRDGNFLDTNLLDPGPVTHSYSFQPTGHYPMLSDENSAYDSVYTLQDVDYYVNSREGPIYRLTIHTTGDFFTRHDGVSVDFIRSFFTLRYTLFWILGIGMLVFAIFSVYLCCAAGRLGADPQVCPSGLNRLPIDLYGLIAAIGCFIAARLAWTIIESWFLYASFNLGAIVLASAVLLIGALFAIGFLFAIAAQVKAPDRYWWQHSISRWMGLQIVRFGRFLRRLFSLLPLTWQWLLTAACMGFFPFLFFCLAALGSSFWLVLLLVSLLADVLIVIYGIYCFGTLLKGARQMAAGELQTKIPTRFLVGAFARCAEHINAMADVATTAAQNQLKSERMKTELITNVSHDIKTPLTSIINYVDLLTKSHTPQEQVQYLEVLGRQSQRLKKLTEDLVEMSKATTGNIPVAITQVDAKEAMTQALGEFADKLSAAQLTAVFCPPEQPVAMQADGRLTWRVLSNLLSNIVKYAQPGTRVYIDLVQAEDQVLLSLKNISREPLNMTADELTERFVRGDASRNTEGSGLGLNIAKSLMELQKGQLQLLVDGDLFKVTLSFPT